MREDAPLPRRFPFNSSGTTTATEPDAPARLGSACVDQPSGEFHVLATRRLRPTTLKRDENHLNINGSRLIGGKLLAAHPDIAE